METAYAQAYNSLAVHMCECKTCQESVPLFPPASITFTNTLSFHLRDLHVLQIQITTIEHGEWAKLASDQELYIQAKYMHMLYFFRLYFI